MELSVKTEYNGKSFVLNRGKVKDAFEHFKDQEIELTVKKWAIKRTSRQNRWFHKACAIIADEQGDDPETTKFEIKDQYCRKPCLRKDGTPKYDKNGNVKTKIVGTSSISSVEFSELQSRVIEIGYFLKKEIGKQLEGIDY